MHYTQARLAMVGRFRRPDLAGRFRRVAQSKQRWKVTHGLDDVVGVEPGGDISRLLPIELAQLTVPELELDTLRRIVERQALCREHHATEPVGKGPIILAIDESGSMQGEKAHTAKALGLALAWIARHQKRWCALCAYSGDSGERLLALPPGRWDETKTGRLVVGIHRERVRHRRAGAGNAADVYGVEGPGWPYRCDLHHRRPVSAPGNHTRLIRRMEAVGPGPAHHSGHRQLAR